MVGRPGNLETRCAKVVFPEPGVDTPIASNQFVHPTPIRVLARKVNSGVGELDRPRWKAECSLLLDAYDKLLPVRWESNQVAALDERRNVARCPRERRSGGLDGCQSVAAGFEYLGASGIQ